MAKKRNPETPEIAMVAPATVGEVLLYQTEDGLSRVEAHLIDETMWLTQKQMSDLFQKDVRTINEHIKNIFAEQELQPDSVIRKFRTTAAERRTAFTGRKTL